MNSEQKGVISGTAKIPSIAIDSFDESLDEINGTVHETLNLVMKAVTCKSELSRKMNYGMIMLFTLFYFIPAVTIITCYSLIFMKLQHVNKNLNNYERELEEKLDLKSEPVISALKSSGIDPAEATFIQSNTRREKSLRKRSKTTVMMATLCLIYLVCYRGVSGIAKICSQMKL